MTYRSRSVPVRARLATPAETDAAFDEAAKVYPGYAKYRERASHRSIRAFVLEAATHDDLDQWLIEAEDEEDTAKEAGSW